MAIFDLLGEAYNGGDVAAELGYGSAMAARIRVRVRGDGSERGRLDALLKQGKEAWMLDSEAGRSTAASELVRREQWRGARSLQGGDGDFSRKPPGRLFPLATRPFSVSFLKTSSISMILLRHSNILQKSEKIHVAFPSHVEAPQKLGLQNKMF